MNTDEIYEYGSQLMLPDAVAQMLNIPFQEFVDMIKDDTPEGRAYNQGVIAMEKSIRDKPASDEKDKDLKELKEFKIQKVIQLYG
ncbi:MAG: hypothetical protein K9J21_11895 [Bacteroidales bacterium]|nr:hypothetical protein [Bacteroidales bacterium]